MIKTLFLSGLFTIIPIAATIFFINFIYGFFSHVIEPLRNVEPSFLQKIPGSEFALVMLLILVTGIIIKIFIVHSIVHYLERLIVKIPLVRIVYSSAKTMVNFFKTPERTQIFEKKVVLIPYPKKGQYHLAFLLEPAYDTYEKIIPTSVKHYSEERYCKVFMPNSPNPTSGYFFIMPEDDVIPTNITFEEAIKALASCGLITPETLKKEGLKPLRP
jgi:uncharacterized membrane protein